MLQLVIPEAISEVSLEEEARGDKACCPPAESESIALHLIEAYHLSDRANVEVAPSEELVPIVPRPDVPKGYHICCV